MINKFIIAKKPKSPGSLKYPDDLSTFIRFKKSSLKEDLPNKLKVSAYILKGCMNISPKFKGSNLNDRLCNKKTIIEKNNIIIESLIQYFINNSDPYLSDFK